MRHFDHLSADTRTRLFHAEPQPFERHDDPATLALALGATLYSPGTRPTLAVDIVKQATAGVASMVICLEDAIADEDVARAEENVVVQLRQLHEDAPATPLLFVRVRHAAQITDLVDRLGEAAEILTGFVLPKFTGETGAEFLDALATANATSSTHFYGMPVLESPEVIFRETRKETLVDVQRLLDKYRDQVLAVRIGATDLCSAYGLRRSRDLTVYDVHLVAEVIADIVNILGRADGSGFVITGPVWEYFSSGDRKFRPQLRQSPFDEHDARALRAKLVARDLDGLIREVELDKATGLSGKTVIHPTHVAAVHALSVVTHEEYSDACDILGEDRTGGGVMASEYANKMNEVKPHRAWAQRTMLRARVFGVAAPGITFVDLLDASVTR